MTDITRDEIQKLEGDDLRRLLAEARGKPFTKPTHGPCCTCQTCGETYDYCECSMIESIEEAWELVEEMTTNQGKFMLYRYGYGTLQTRDKWNLCWRCSAGDARNNLHPYADADTPELAICRMYLIWKLKAV